MIIFYFPLELLIYFRSLFSQKLLSLICICFRGILTFLNLFLFFNLKAEILLWKIFAPGEHEFIDTIIIFIHSFLLNNVFVAGNKLNTKRNKTSFIFYAPDFPPLNSRVKNGTSFKFLFYVRFYIIN